VISVNQAVRLMLKNTSPVGITKLPLNKAAGLVLAEDIYARNDLPLFTNSAMDGYAVKSSQTKGANQKHPLPLRLVGTLKAGSLSKRFLGNGEAIKIMTGAPLPAGADAVVMKENTTEQDGWILIQKEAETKENIRLQAEEIKKGALALKKFTLLNPPALGFLSSLGVKEVKIFRIPKVTMVITGNEVVSSANRLGPGKIYESNSVGLVTALKEIGIHEVQIFRCRDNPLSLKRNLGKALALSDIVLISGGVSVGDYDYVRQTLSSLKAKQIFWKVSQKPGKPLYFGRNGKTLIFGIPGNPAASLVVFYEYIRPALLKFLGRKHIHLPLLTGQMAREIAKKKGLTYFWRGALSGPLDKPIVQIPSQQGSHMLKEFARGDCLVIGPEKSKFIQKGTQVTVHLLPWSRLA